MAKTFYWVGGATGSNALDKYNWNQPRNWVVKRNSLVTPKGSGGTVRIDTSAYNDATADESVSYCPGPTDFVIIGDSSYPAKSPLLFGGCGTTANASSAIWQNATTSTGSGNSLGLNSITIYNNTTEKTNNGASYPFKWVGGGLENITTNERLTWVKEQNPDVDVESLLSTNTQDLRIIVHNQVMTNVGMGYNGTLANDGLGAINGDLNEAIQILLYFKAPGKTLIGSSNLVRTKFIDQSDKAVIGLFNGYFDSVLVKQAPILTGVYFGGPGDRYIMLNDCKINDVMFDKYGGSFHIDINSKINTMSVNETQWYGWSRGSVTTEKNHQQFIIQNNFESSVLTEHLGHSIVSGLPSARLNVGPVTYIGAGLIYADRPSGSAYNIEYPPTITLGTDPSSSLLGDYQTCREFNITGTQYDSFGNLDGRWHVSFAGSLDYKLVNAKNTILKLSPIAPAGPYGIKVGIGTANLSENSEITFTNQCPIVDAGTQDGWYFGKLDNTLSGGLRFLDNSCVVWGGKGVVMANTTTLDINGTIVDNTTGTQTYNNDSVSASITQV